MRLLVTGGAGFIGSALIRYLLAKSEHTVINVDNLTYAARQGSLIEVQGNNRYTFEKLNICDTAALRAVISKHQPESVIHLAAESHVDRSLDAPAEFIATNVMGTYSLLEASLDHWARIDEAGRQDFRFVHVSTDEVFGSARPDQRFTNADPYCPNSPYAATKASADHLVRAWQKSFGLPTITCISTNNFGPYQYPEKLIPLTIAKALNDETIPVYGDGQQMRDWIHVDDHVRGIVAALVRGLPGQTYLFGSARPRANIEVVQAICDILDRYAPRAAGEPCSSLIRHVPDRPGHDRRYAIDPSAAIQALQWHCEVPFESGLEETVRWYLDNPEWWNVSERERRGLGRADLGNAAGEARAR